jgi:hypothetical protein
MRATDLRSKALRLAAPALLLLVAFACGDDTKKVIPPVSDTVDVRNGTWHRVRTYSVSGADSCEAPAPDTSDVVLCAFDPGAGRDAIGLICDIAQSGDHVTVTCEGSLDLFPCRLDYHFEGSGTVTDTTLDITMRRWMTLDAREGSGSICDSLYTDPCTTTVVTRAAWSVADTASVCADTTSAPSVRDFLNRMLKDGPPR